MLSPLLSLAIDVLITSLLIATIVFAWRLNGRLKVLRENRDELAATVAAFNEATQRAETSIGQLKRAASEAADQLQGSIGKARASQDELAIMLETADSLARRLEHGSSQVAAAVREQQNFHDMRLPSMPSSAVSQQVMATAQQAASGGQPPLTAGPKPRSKSEQELLQAIEKMR
jgi:methyl-accepting chemotaxis protein